MRPVNIKLLDAVTTTTISQQVKTDFTVACSVVATATGSITGTITIQGSNDSVNPVNWADIPNVSANVSGMSGTVMIPKTDLCYNFIKVTFTKQSGTGTVTANYQGFGLN